MSSQLKVSIALVAMGMLGLYGNVEYSGWVLFFGMVGAVFGD